MKKILGLDLGTNSIGWALIEQNFENKQGSILGMGTRVIPMGQDIIGDFGKGNSISQTAERTRLRSARKLRQRHLLRRERLHRVLNNLGFLPHHYQKQIDFQKRLGQFTVNTEPKLAYQTSVSDLTGKVNYDFLFKSSFESMLEDFRKTNPDVLVGIKGQPRLIPFDWTIYFLRKKALTDRIEKEELAWILLNFNQKRGYYQLRGEEDEEISNKLVEYHSLKVVEVSTLETAKNKTDMCYALTLENGWVYKRSSKVPLFDWKGKTKDFIVTTELNDDGTVKLDRDGLERRSFRAPSEDDWTLLKKKTEADIEKSGKTVGTYIYESLLCDPKQKIKGKLVRTIERKYYKDELNAILKKQIEFHPVLRDEDVYNECVRELYRNNDVHQHQLAGKDFLHLLINDIIFYQRPLRSQKGTISNCSLEFRLFKNDEGQVLKQHLKAIHKSNPYYQEFRIWQWIYNLAIYDQDKINVTNDFLSNTSDYESLFEFLNDKKEVDQKAIFRFFLEKRGMKGKALSAEAEKYRWNYVEDKKYPCNETRNLIISRLTKIGIDYSDFLTKEVEMRLWHIIYSVTDKKQFEQALKSFANKHQLDTEQFIEVFKRTPPFKSDYGAFSEKAIKRLLPLLRCGKYWSWEAMDDATKDRILKIITGEYDPSIKERVRAKTILLSSEADFQRLPLWLAQYVVYDRHSEASEIVKWKSSDELKEFIDDFKQHSLRNPIVEQVVTETLRVVNDIWNHYGNGSGSFFDEIHVELGREMKSTSEQRKNMTIQITQNENTNHRIKYLLAEMAHDSEVQNVRPYSPVQQEILKIYEDGVLNSELEIEEDIIKILKTPQPSASDLRKYKLWLEQKYRSPYTGEVIPLNKLFTPEYEIEHIIPQSRYFDDSLSNKIICEAAVNKLKDNCLGLEFVTKFHGQIVEIGFGRKVKIFEVDAYKDFLTRHYAKNRAKKSKLLLEDIPEAMIERQLNDTRYISKYITSILSNIVRSDDKDDGINSKNVIPGNGRITDELKRDWGLNDVWNDLILPRFERLNKLTGTAQFTVWNERHQKFLPTVPLELSKGFSKKRIDHRHHAMDALVIACATRDHVNLLNNKHAKSSVRFDLNRKLRRFERVSYNNAETGQVINREVPREFLKPWDSFTVDAKSKLEQIIVSFKQNLRVVNKATNSYQKWVLAAGKKEKQWVEQLGTNWAIRKPLHKDTVSSIISIRKKKIVSINNAIDDYVNIVNKKLKQEIKRMLEDGLDKNKILKLFKGADNKFQNKDISKIEIYYFEQDNVATRSSLNETFDPKSIESITDTGIQKILHKHLSQYSGRLDEKGKEIPPHQMAFAPEGIEEMNKNIVQLNDGKFHQPIYKVRTYEPKGYKFTVGQKGNKRSKFVEAAKGTNLFFAIYVDSAGKRKFETMALNVVIERFKQGLTAVPETSDNGDKLLFYLSPNDLVTIPVDEIDGDDNTRNPGEINYVYKVVSFSGSQIFFVAQNIATPIVNKVEFSALNKMERTVEGIMIKDCCQRLKIDRIGRIS